MAHLVHNARAKLIANALDRGSTGCFATGIFVPTAAAMLGQPNVPAGQLITALGARILAGVVLHIEARRVIGTLRE